MTSGDTGENGRREAAEVRWQFSYIGRCADRAYGSPDLGDNRHSRVVAPGGWQTKGGRRQLGSLTIGTNFGR